MRKAFTIVELLLVVAIIGILLGLSVTAISGAIGRARVQKANACVTLVNQGASVYYTQNGKWPGQIGSQVENGSVSPNDTGKTFYDLTTDTTRDIIRDMVKEARDGKPVMDVSGLFVSRSSGERGSKSYGIDFISAIRGTRKSHKKMSLSEMWFGYPESQHGYFRAFRAKYNPKTDQLIFYRQDAD